MSRSQTPQRKESIEVHEPTGRNNAPPRDGNREGFGAKKIYIYLIFTHKFYLIITNLLYDKFSY